MRVKEMLTEVGRLFDPGLSPVFSGEAKPGDPATQVADVTRLRAWGFEPWVERRAGIAAYVAWFQREFGEKPACAA
jgi:UDP-glucose 4-epimerase